VHRTRPPTVTIHVRPVEDAPTANNDPTTQTTLKRRTGWVRGGYD